METMTEPDGITGAVAAIQGIRDVRLLLHGQNGCRKGLLPLERCMPGDGIPYTDVSPADYYGGTAPKLERSLDALSGEGLVAVLETPALTLIGDDVEGMARSREGCIRLDTDSLGNDIGTGFDSAIVSVLDHLAPERSETIENGVNILGLSVAHKDWRAVRMEMGHLLKSAGLRLVSVVGAGCTLGELRDSVRSGFNIVVDPEFCSRTVGFYEAMGVETVGIGCQPVGFDRVDDLYRAVSEATGRRTSHAFEMLGQVPQARLRRHSGLWQEPGREDLRDRRVPVRLRPSVLLAGGLLRHGRRRVRPSGLPVYQRAQGLPGAGFRRMRERRGRALSASQV